MVDGAGGSAGTAASFFLTVFINLIIRNRLKEKMQRILRRDGGRAELSQSILGREAVVTGRQAPRNFHFPRHPQSTCSRTKQVESFTGIIHLILVTPS